MKICNFCAKEHTNLKGICENTFLSNNKTIIIEDLLKIFPIDLVELFSFNINCSICRGCLQQLEKCYTFVQQIREAGVKLKHNIVIKQEQQHRDSQMQMETFTIHEETSNTSFSAQAGNSSDTHFKGMSGSLAYNFKRVLPKILNSTNTPQKEASVLPHIVSRLYKCLECTQAFKSFKHLRQHEAEYCNRPSVNGIFICKYCHLCFQKERSLEEHQFNLHPQQQFVCCLCNDKGFAYKGYLTRHISQVHEHKCLKYFCGECKELLILSNQESVQIHFKEAHSLECNKGNDDKPDSQPDSFNEEDMDLEMHEEFLDEFLLAHTNENSFQFSECWDALDLHLPDMLHGNTTSFHNNQEFPEAFPCPKCFEQFKNPQPLLRHLAEQHNMPVLICRTCRKAFPTFKDFKDHKIDKCLRNLSMDPLAIHCPYCKKLYKTYLSLKQHLRIVHSQHKKHICQLCDKLFSTLDHLKKHVLSQHQNERKHICYICSKTFTQLCHLKQHLSIHTTGKTIQCIECPAKFWRKVDMDRHRVKRHAAI